jgi:hypothetical protein
VTEKTKMSLTEFCLPPEQVDTTIQEVYAALADDRVRNELILAEGQRFPELP